MSKAYLGGRWKLNHPSIAEPRAYPDHLIAGIADGSSGRTDMEGGVSRAEFELNSEVSSLLIPQTDGESFSKMSGHMVETQANRTEGSRELRRV